MIPPFPRIPRFAGQVDDDELISEEARIRFLSSPVVVEEKLDGANVAVQIDETGQLHAHGRSGPTGRDRANQFGRLRAWAAERRSALRELLDPDEVLYGEWLWLEHSVSYDALPDFFVALDIWNPQVGFLATDARDARCEEVEIAVVPILFRGVLRSTHRLAALLSRSRFGVEEMEGLVVRRESGDALIERAKWIAPNFKRKPDTAWAGAPRYNRVANNQREDG